MKIMYSQSEYNKLQKEVCYLINELKQLTDSICSEDLWSDFTLQSNATCKAIKNVDTLKTYLCEMNLMSYNIAIGNTFSQEVLDDSTDVTESSSDSIDNNID